MAEGWSFGFNCCDDDDCGCFLRFSATGILLIYSMVLLSFDMIIDVGTMVLLFFPLAVVVG